MLSRRQFIPLAVAFTTLPTAPATSIRLTGRTLATMPADFTGFSYENPQLYDPAFFSPANTQLIQLYRALSPSGVLRLGGNLSDNARWNGQNGDFATSKQSAGVEHGKTYWEWKLTTQSVRDHRDGAITPEAIRNLRGFLDATGWRCIYGLNFGCGSPERAADESAFVVQTLGPRLLSLQLGNEADFWGGNSYFRQKPFPFADYLGGYNEFATAIRQRTPGAPLAGPDTATNFDWVRRFAQDQSRQPATIRARFLSSHHYAMGPAKDPAMDATRLLGPDSGLASELATVIAAATSSGIPFRLTELNSCFGGGKPGVSDAFASALWGADISLRMAAAGVAAANFHGGGDGFYTPIETLDTGTATPRPLYFGLQFAQQFAGLTLVEAQAETPANVSVYAGRAAGMLKVALINKSDTRIDFALDKSLPQTLPSEALLLSAPSLDAKTGVTLASTPPSRTGALAPYSAQLLTWRG